MTALRDLHYSRLPDECLTLDLYLPDEGAVATLIYIHGGGLVAGDKSDTSLLRETLLAGRIAVASVNYRMYPNAVFPQFIEDAAEAVAWVLANAARYGLGDRIFVGGSSAGGYLSMMLCFAPEYLGAHGLCPDQLAGYILDAGQPTAHFRVLEARGLDSRRVIVDEAAPLYHIQSCAPMRPLLILVSDDDIPCRLEQNQLLRKTLLHFGYPEHLIEFHVMEGYPHCRYIRDVDPSGAYPYGDIVRSFIARGAR